MHRMPQPVRKRSCSPHITKEMPQAIRMPRLYLDIPYSTPRTSLRRLLVHLTKFQMMKMRMRSMACYPRSVPSARRFARSHLHQHRGTGSHSILTCRVRTLPKSLGSHQNSGPHRPTQISTNRCRQHRGSPAGTLMRASLTARLQGRYRKSM